MSSWGLTDVQMIICAGTLAWDKILLASGGVPRALDLPGAGLANLFTLRSFRA